ncbi:tetratricopeptide repeat protein [bacterium]|nr:tetratricopeptide repeat protein [bacterium]
MKRQMLLMIMVAFIVLIMLGCENTYITSAKVYMQQRQYDKAIEMCETAISQSPSNPDAYFVLGKAYYEKGDHRQMNEAFKKSLEIDPKNANEIDYFRAQSYRDLFNSASQLSENQKYDEAAEKYELATEILPDRHEAYLNLAVTYLQAENDSMAIQTYLRALNEMPDSLRFAYNLGLTHYNNADYEQAVKAFSQVVEKSESSSKLYFESLFNMANAYAMLKQEDKALEIYEQALKNDPENTMILFNMGRMLLLQEKYEKAIEVLEKVLAVSPDDYDANFAIGTAYLQINNELIDIFNQKVDEMSKSEAKEHKEEMEMNFKKALPHFEKAVELKPDNSSAWQQLGTVYVRLGETKKGEEAFAKSDELRAQGN